MKHSVTAVTLFLTCAAAQAQQFARLQQFERRFVVVQRNHYVHGARSQNVPVPPHFGLASLSYQALPGGSGLKGSLAQIIVPHSDDGWQTQTRSASVSWSHSKGVAITGGIDLHGDYQFNHDKNAITGIANLDGGVSTGQGPDITPAVTLQSSIMGGALLPSITPGYQFGDTSAFIGSAALQWFASKYVSLYVGGSLASRATGASAWNAGMLYSLDPPSASQQRALVFEYDQGRTINVGFSWKFPY